MGDSEVWNVPIGPAITGGFAAVLASELIDDLLAPNYRKWWFRLTLRIIRKLPKRISIRLLERLSHSRLRAFAKLSLAAQFQDNPWLFGSKTMSLLLAYDAVKELAPFEELAGKAIKELVEELAEKTEVF